MADGIKIPIGAQLDPGDVQAQIDKMIAAMNRMGRAVADANKVHYTPVDKGTIEDLRKITAQFEQLKRVSESLRSGLRASGQQGLTSFFDVDFAQLYTDPAQRARQSMRHFEYVTGREFGIPPSAPAPVRAPRAPRAPGGAASGSPWLPGGVLGNPLHAGLQALGPVGGVASSALTSGLREEAGTPGSGFGAGVMGFVGGLAALAVGGAISSIKNKVGAAGQEMIGYDTLKRQIGDVGVSFEMLKQSLRAASYSIGTTFEETQQLGREFARLSGTGPGGAGSLADEVTVAGGFGRAFGIAPERAVSFFGQMAGVGITHGADDMRRFATMIGETIVRTGRIGAGDDVLQALASYGLAQTRGGLAAANLSAYGGALAGLVSSGIPGLDVQGSANVLSRMNSAIAGGGAAGEAGQFFLYRALGAGLDPIQARILQEQGIFGTRGMAFGPHSAYAAFAKRYGLAMPGGGDGTTNLSAITTALQRMYGGRVNGAELMADAFSHLTGLNLDQSLAVLATPAQQMGSLGSALSRNHIDLSTLSATGISALAQVATGGRSTLLAQGNALLATTGKGALSGADAGTLRGLMAGGDTEKLRDELIKLTASREQEQTIGSQTRDSVQNMDKTPRG